MEADQLQSIQQQITAGHFQQALESCETALLAEPENLDLLYMAAVCLRYLKAFDAAIAKLQVLKSQFPEHGRALQEEGHVYRDSGQPKAALQAYALACQYNPALLAAWRAQLALLSGTGRAAQISFIENRLAELEALPRPLLGAMDLIHQGKLLKAEEICRQFLKQVPHHVAGMRLLADIGSRLGVLDDAEFLLESAVAFEPNNAGARMEYIQVLRKKQKFAEALNQASQLLASQPENPQYQSLFAIESMQTGDYQTALETFDQVLATVPDDPITLTSRGHAQKTVGQTEEAIASYGQAIRSQPAHGEAWYSLANLKTYRFADEQVSAMQVEINNPNLGYMDRVYLGFALGKAFEDRGDYASAFQHYESGNQLKKAQSRYSADQMTADLQAQIRVCTEALMARRAQSGCVAGDPIFVLGLPRAGSTLLEQILASHSQVEGTLELPNILALSQKLRRGGVGSDAAAYPDVLEQLSDDELRAFGEQYIDDTQVHRHGTPYFIDKMPNNFRHIGLIKLILPNAKIIDARRHPMSCCFSGYKQLFAEGQEFSYSLADIGQYYRDYIELMSHWDHVLPGEILTVHHEAVVDDLEGQVRRLLDFCGLPFEQSCVDYHKTERSVRTPSSEQVRQPIFRDSIDAWQNFDPWLKPLKSALGPELLEQYGVNSH